MAFNGGFLSKETDNASLLESRVLAAVRPILGDELIYVTYWALRFELASSGQIDDPDFYFGGEVELRFKHSGTIFISWDENAGWSHHYSVQARTSSAFLPGALVAWPARGVGVWPSLIGSRLTEAEILGAEGVPHVIVLALAGKKVCIGDGHERTFCDGDDILVRIGDSVPQLPLLERVWESGRRR